MNKLHTMSDKELNRLEVMTQISTNQLTRAQAAEQLRLSVRQVKRLWRAYSQQDAAGLIHKSRGKPSHNQLKEEVKQRVPDLLLEYYSDFGPTLAAEKLMEIHGLRISDEKVRQIMMAEGLWKSRRKRKLQVFQMRQRRAMFGEFVQIDGSDFDLFEGRSPRRTLLVFVDAAIGKLVELQFVPHESFNTYCAAAQRYFARYDKPRTFYSDKHGTFHLNNPRLTRGDRLTDFGRAMHELGVPVNPVSADESSLARGKASYDTACALCHRPTSGGEGAFAGFLAKFPPANLVKPDANARSISDGAIFMTITDGIEGRMLALHDNLPTAEMRWDVVNYVRFLQPSAE